jgi:transcriptional regulator with XRE-family HTH domain
VIMAPDDVVRRRRANGRKARDADFVGGEVPRRLRAERERRGISVRELARRLDMTPSAISQIETGKARPSVSTLYAIVSELGMSMDELFGGGRRTPAAAGPEVVVSGLGLAAAEALLQRADSRRAIELETGVRWERLTAASDPEVDFLLVHYPVGSASSAGGVLMRHAGREYGLVLSGRLEVTVAFETYVLEAGDSISFASTTPHRLANVGDEPVTGIWVVIGRRGTDARADGLIGEDIEQSFG